MAGGQRSRETEAEAHHQSEATMKLDRCFKDLFHRNATLSAIEKMYTEKKTVAMPKQKSEHTRPAGRITAYAFFQKAYLKKHLKPTGDKSKMVFKCTEEWKKMTESDKEPWLKLEEEDRERYNKQLKEWEERNPLKGTSKRHVRIVPKKVLKARDAPKHPLSAFFWWGYTERPLVTRENPGYGVCAISKILGEKWKRISPDIRLQYELMAERDKMRYRREKAEYMKKTEERTQVQTNI